MRLNIGGTFVLRTADWECVAKNAVTAAGIDAMLSGWFAGGSIPASWYIGLIDATAYEQVSDADTLSSHPGWQEWTRYEGEVRKQWTPATVSLRAVIGQDCVFTPTEAGEIRGIFVASASSGVSGILWATSVLPLPRLLRPNAPLTVSYSLSVN